MTQAELLRYLVDTLDSLAIDYMIVGSHASIYYGEPRFTQDVDIVTDLTPSALPGLLRRFPPTEFDMSEAAAYDAVAQRGQFNSIHGASGVPGVRHTSGRIKAQGNSVGRRRHPCRQTASWLAPLRRLP